MKEGEIMGVAQETIGACCALFRGDVHAILAFSELLEGNDGDLCVVNNSVNPIRDELIGVLPANSILSRGIMGFKGSVPLCASLGNRALAESLDRHIVVCVCEDECDYMGDELPLALVLASDTKFEGFRLGARGHALYCDKRFRGGLLYIELRGRKEDFYVRFWREGECYCFFYWQGRWGVMSEVDFRLLSSSILSLAPEMARAKDCSLERFVTLTRKMIKEGEARQGRDCERIIVNYACYGWRGCHFLADAHSWMILAGDEFVRLVYANLLNGRRLAKTMGAN